jgi:hypothetical protein
MGGKSSQILCITLHVLMSANFYNNCNNPKIGSGATRAVDCLTENVETILARRPF